MNRPALRTIATSIIALTLPLTMLAGVIATAFYKTNNPADVDITGSLAYLRETMTVSIIVFALCVAIVVGLIVKMYRRDQNFVNAKLPMVLLGILIVLVIGIALLNGYTNKVQDQYLIDHGRPTMQEFFDRLEKQEKN